MKILLAHEFYQSASPSGEDAMYQEERRLLMRAGHEVVTFELHNDSIGASPTQRVRVAAETLWSRRSLAAVRRLVADARPDVAHFHNTFPLISPSAYHACQLEGVPVVQTLHNFRLICPSGLLQRNGVPCEDCVGRVPVPAIRHSCYRESRAASAVAAAMLVVNRARGTYFRDVDRYLALTEFARSRFVRGGLPAERVVVRPNGLSDDPGVGVGDGGYALFVGRLSQEKGVHSLVRAWKEVRDLPLRIAGDGPLRAELESSVGAAKIEFLGRQPRARVLELMRAATMIVMPSECYEGLPVTFMEALACGTPIAASNLGALGQLMVDGVNGIHFPAANVSVMAAAVNALNAQPEWRRAIRQRNRDEFLLRYSAAAALTSLETVYRTVINGLDG